MEERVAAGKQPCGRREFPKAEDHGGVLWGRKRELAAQMLGKKTGMRCISYNKLVEGDDGACAELLAASTNEGYFWLDLNSEVELVNRVDWLLRMSQTLHDLPEEEKWKYEEERPDGSNNIRYVRISI